MDVNIIAAEMTEEKIKIGYTIETVMNHYKERFFPVVVFFHSRGSTEWSAETANQYRDYLMQKLESGAIYQTNYNSYMRGINELEEYVNTGKLPWPFTKVNSSYQLNPFFEKIRMDYTKSEDFHPNTLDDIIWCTNRYFNWLQYSGYENFDSVDASVIQEYLRVTSLCMEPGSMYNIKLYLKKLYKYLAATGYSDTDYELLFSFRVSRKTIQQPAADSEEVRLTIAAIDQTTDKGKRDYAIILLGALLGMRASDISRLKLNDIDWANGEIRFYQKKTMKPVVLPLVHEVGKALKRYILEARPKCNHEEIFIRMKAPRQPFVDCMGVEHIYREYRRKAGLPREPFDGRGFHSLRRALGKNMITSGVPVTTVSQVLGHTSIRSTKQYIALDSVHLKECALDFKGIEVAYE